MAYLTGSRSNFPNEIDKITEKFDLSPRQLQLAKRWQNLNTKIDRTHEEEAEFNNLTIELQDFQRTAEDLNKAFDMVIRTQKHYRDNTIGHVNQLKQETSDYVDAKKQEISTTVIKGQTAINTTQDNALISIEQKKENIIEYMDSTTAGQIRNDIGITSDLTTTDKSNLVNAINELNSKEIDLTPIDDKLNEHIETNITAHNVSRGMSNFAGSGQEITIPHGLDVIPKSAYAFPKINPKGYLGEVWIRMDKTNIYVGNSGSFDGAMSWTAIG